jgi:hypothetical protein
LPDVTIGRGTIRGLDEIKRVLGRLSKADMRSLWKDLANQQILNIKHGVQRGEAVPSGRLVPSKAARARGGQTLINTGSMLRSLDVVSLSHEQGVVGFNAPLEAAKGVWAQDGTRRGLPPRPWFGFRNADRGPLDRAMQAWLGRVMAKAGGRGR